MDKEKLAEKKHVNHAKIKVTWFMAKIQRFHEAIDIEIAFLLVVLYLDN